MSTKNLPLVSPDTVTQAKDATMLKDLDGEIPQHVLDDIHDHRRFIWWSLLFLNGSVLWAYYSGL
ncbi:hypothetical protein DYB36_008041, partial [Aphanomyces astaci]